MRAKARKKKQRKTGQLQIRVSPAQKRAIQEQAAHHGMSMSDWVLSRALPSTQSQFAELVAELSTSETPGHVFAELLELLSRLDPAELRTAVAELPSVALTPYWENYVAASVEHAAARSRIAPPAWTAKIPPLEQPAFGSPLKSLRLYLLTHSPPAFCRRNLFVDASVGERV